MSATIGNVLANNFQTQYAVKDIEADTNYTPGTKADGAMDGGTDAVDISNTARDIEKVHSKIKDDNEFVDKRLIDSLRAKWDSLPNVSETMANVIAERIIRGYSDSILAS